MVVTDLNTNNQTDFVLSARAFSAMAHKGKDRDLIKLGIVDVEYKRYATLSFPNIHTLYIRVQVLIFNCNDFVRFNFVFEYSFLQKKEKIPTSKIKTSTTLHLSEPLF